MPSSDKAPVEGSEHLLAAKESLSPQGPLNATAEAIKRGHGRWLLVPYSGQQMAGRSSKHRRAARLVWTSTAFVSWSLEPFPHHPHLLSLPPGPSSSFDVVAIRPPPPNKTLLHLSKSPPSHHLPSEYRLRVFPRGLAGPAAPTRMWAGKRNNGRCGHG